MRSAPLIALALLAPSIAHGAAGRPIPVGAAKVDITPDAPILLSGYLARGTEPSKGVQSPIRAEALAIGGDEEGAALLVTVDNLGVPDSMT